jgi:hypothetical protein
MINEVGLPLAIFGYLVPVPPAKIVSILDLLEVAYIILYEQSSAVY